MADNEEVRPAALPSSASPLLTNRPPSLLLYQLVDYEEDEVIAPVVKGEPQGEDEVVDDTSDDKDKKGSYVGIHSTGFRSVSLLPLARSSCGDVWSHCPTSSVVVGLGSFVGWACCIGD